MSDYDNGYRAAQRAYDRQEPPDNSKYCVECPSCDGGGVNEEGDICGHCDGDGSVILSAHEYRSLMNEAKAEEDEASADSEI